MKNYATHSILLPTNNKGWFLQEHQLLKYEKSVLQITSLVNGTAILQHTVTKEKKLIPEHALIEALQSGMVTAVETEIDSVDDLTDRDKDELKLRKVSIAAARTASAKNRWIKEIYKKGIDKIKDTARVRLAIAEIAANEMAGEKEFRISTLAKAQRKQREFRDGLVCLVPRYEDRGGKGKSRLDAKVELIIQDELDREREKTDNITQKEIIENIQERVIKLRLTSPAELISVPSESTIARRLKQNISEYDLHVRKHGKKSADRAFRESGERVTAAHPLDVIEYDDVDINVFAIDSRTGLPHGRAFLTSGIDQYSGVVMGYDFGYEHRSTESAVNAILDGMLPKDTFQSKYGDLKHPWIGYGVAGLNLLDNALYNHSNETLRIQMDAMNIAGWSRPRQPTDKSSIENFNKIIQNDFASKLEGWVGTDDNRFGTLRGLEGAIYTTQELEKKFIDWTVGVYTHKKTVNGTTPRELWRRYYNTRGPVVTWSRAEIDLLKMTPTSKRIREGGVILVAGLRYSSEALQKIKKSIGVGKSLEIYESRDQLKYILIKHPHTGVLLRAECIEDSRYTDNLKRRQQTLILKAARKSGYKHPDFSTMVNARNALREETDMGRMDKKLSRRKLALHKFTPDFSNEQPSVNEKKEVEVLVTDLEMSVYELDHVEINADEEWL